MFAKTLRSVTLFLSVAALTAMGGCASSNSPRDHGVGESQAGMRSGQIRAGRMHSGEATLHDVLQAHGGKQLWESYRGYALRTNHLPVGGKARTDKTFVNLKTREIRVDGQGYTLGIDRAGQTWIAPSRDALKAPANFYVALPFYFNAMPFVFSDPAARVASTGTKQFRGQTYKTLRVTYADNEGNAGNSPHDAYNLYVDPQTNQLKMIHFQVTHPMMMKKTGGKPIHEWLVFNQWQRVGGLLIPARATFYHSKNGRMAGKIGSYTVTDASFSGRPPASSLFAKPRGAVIAPSP